MGVTDETYFEVGHAFIITDGADLTAQAIREHCKSELANYKIPKQFFFVEMLPLLPNGKVDKKALGAISAAGVSS